VETGDDDQVAAAGKEVLSGLAVALACVLAACGSESATGEDRTADTARVELVITRSDREGRLVLSGAYDYRRRQGSVTAKLEGTEGADTDTPDEIRFFGDRFYREMAWEGKTYWVLDAEDHGIGHLEQVVVPFPGGELDPKEALRVILGRGKPDELGREDLRDTSTTHYRVRLEPKDVSSELGGRPIDVEAGTLEAEVWGDDADRVRRIRIADQDATLTYEFFEFGVDVGVERPPEDQVVTPAEFDRITEDT
jgi:hypothetical protein